MDGVVAAVEHATELIGGGSAVADAEELGVLLHVDVGGDEEV